MKKVLIGMLLSSTALAVELDIPVPNPNVAGNDTFTTSNGTTCSTSINSPGGYVDYGIAVNKQIEDGRTPFENTNGSINTNDATDATVYIRYTIPLGASAPRVDCNRIYELELEKLRAEIAALRAAEKAALNTKPANEEKEIDNAVDFNIDFPDDSSTNTAIK